MDNETEQELDNGDENALTDNENPPNDNDDENPLDDDENPLDDEENPLDDDENPLNDDVNDTDDISSVEGSTSSTKSREGRNRSHMKRAATAIERDKAVRRKVSKLTNKEVTLRSSEALASAIRDMSQAVDKRRKNDLLLWFEHEKKEKDKDRELQKMELEMKERESQRRYELEMTRLRQSGHSFHYGFPSNQPVAGYHNPVDGNVYENKQDQPQVHFGDRGGSYFDLS